MFAPAFLAAFFHIKLNNKTIKPVTFLPSLASYAIIINVVEIALVAWRGYNNNFSFATMKTSLVVKYIALGVILAFALPLLWKIVSNCKKNNSSSIKKIGGEVQAIFSTSEYKPFFVCAYVTALIIFMTYVALLSLNYKTMDFNVFTGLNGGDAGIVNVTAKNIRENGIYGFFFNPRVGAPETASWYDTPFFDIILLFQIFIITLFTPTAAYTVYILLVSTFILSAVSMFFLLHKLKINLVTNFVISSLFSLAPFHFSRYIGHINVGNYFTIPLGIYLCLYVIGYFKTKEENQSSAENTISKKSLIICTVLVGLGYIYNVFFICIAMCVAYMYAFIRSENKKNEIKKLWILGAILVLFILGISPKLVFSMLYGTNTVASIRNPTNQEIYGLKIIQLFVPPANSRIPFLRNIAAGYNNSGAPLINENRSSSLGIIASIGFILLIICFFYFFILKKEKKDSTLVFEFSAISTIVLILFCTIGGVGAIFNFLVSPQFRSQNRVSIFIACFSFLPVAYFLNFIFKKKNIFGYLLCVIIFAVGLYDQVSHRADGWQTHDQNMQIMYKDFFDKIENHLEPHDMVYQLPSILYPEQPPVNKMVNYTNFKPYLLTDTLRWTYGSIKGRDMIAENLNKDAGMSERFLYGIKQAGFSGVYIDTLGFADSGKEITDFYNNFVGMPIISQNKQLYFYDIRGLDFSSDVNTSTYVIAKNSEGRVTRIMTTYDDSQEILQSIFGNKKDVQWLSSRFEKLDKDNISIINIPKNRKIYAPTSYMLGDTISWKDIAPYVESGLSRAEKEFAWTNGKQLLLQFGVKNATENMRCKIELYNVFNKSQRVTVYANDTLVYDGRVSRGHNITFDCTPLDKGLVNLQIDLPEAVSPKALNMSSDARDLALAIRSVSFIEAEPRNLITVKNFAKKYGVAISDDEIMSMAKKSPHVMQIDTYETIYRWLISYYDLDNMSDEDYLNVVYNDILQREPDDEGMKYYLDFLSKGGEKQDVFYSLIDSNEFRNLVMNND